MLLQRLQCNCNSNGAPAVLRCCWLVFGCRDGGPEVRRAKESAGVSVNNTWNLDNPLLIAISDLSHIYRDQALLPSFFALFYSQLFLSFVFSFGFPSLIFAIIPLSLVLPMFDTGGAWCFLVSRPSGTTSKKRTTSKEKRLSFKLGPTDNTMGMETKNNVSIAVGGKWLQQR